MRTHTLYFVITTFILSLLLYSSLSYADSWQKASLPVSQDLYAVWGSSDSDIYVAGAVGTLIHFDGVTWHDISINTPQDLTSVWETPLTAVFVAGDNGTILMNDGTGWISFATNTVSRLNALWGLSITNIYAVGSLGTILSFNGISWGDATPSITNETDLYSIWGDDTGNNIYVGGQNGTMFHYDGTTWKAVSSIPTYQDLRSLWGSSGSDIYAADTEGDILHYNGSAWTAKSMSGLALYALWGSAADDVFAAGAVGNVYHYDGHSWSSLSNNGLFGSNIDAIWGSTSGKVYFAGQYGTILIYSRDDIIPPVINSYKISKNNDGTAYISTPVTFLFSEKMNAKTINSSTVIMKSGSTVVSGGVSLSSDGMTLSVSGDDSYSTPYTITVTGGSNGVKDLAGNALASSYPVSFTTEAEPPSTGSSGGGCFISSARM